MHWCFLILVYSRNYESENNSLIITCKQTYKTFAFLHIDTTNRSTSRQCAAFRKSFDPMWNHLLDENLNSNLIQSNWLNDSLNVSFDNNIWWTIIVTQKMLFINCYSYKTIVRYTRKTTLEYNCVALDNKRREGSRGESMATG